MPVTVVEATRFQTISMDGFNTVGLEEGHAYGIPNAPDWVFALIASGALKQITPPKDEPFMAIDLSRNPPIKAPLVSGEFYYHESVRDEGPTGAQSQWVPSQVPDAVAPTSKLLGDLPPLRTLKPEAAPKAKATKPGKGAQNA